MSLLQRNSNELDDAALGEELTKGSSHLVITTIIAAVVVSIAVAIYVMAGQKPPDATGEIEQVWAHAQHSESSGFDANGSPMPKEAMDQVYVFALVKVHNQSKEPLFMHNIMTNTTLDDGIHSSYAATAGGLRSCVYCVSDHAGAARPWAFAHLHHQSWSDSGGNDRFSFPDDKTAMGCAQGSELYLRLPIQAQPDHHTPGRCYRPVEAGAGALLGVDR